MRKILLCACLLGSLALHAQKDGKTVAAPQQLKEGKIIYEREMQLQMQFRDAPPELANRLPKSQKTTFELLFGKNQSVWQVLPSAVEEANTFSEGGNVFRFSRMGADDVVFTDLASGKRLSQRELNAKNYLVEDTLSKLTWKLTDDTKEVLGYTVRKAVAQRFSTRSIMSMENGEMKRREVGDTSSIVAWFSTDIPVAVGPDFQSQLPGAILELDINNGRTVYKAVEISPKVSLSAIKEPKGGKRISAADYRVEQDKALEEMRSRMSTNGGQIRIQTSQ